MPVPIPFLPPPENSNDSMYLQPHNEQLPPSQPIQYVAYERVGRTGLRQVATRRVYSDLDNFELVDYLRMANTCQELASEFINTIPASAKRTIFQALSDALVAIRDALIEHSITYQNRILSRRHAGYFGRH